MPDSEDFDKKLYAKIYTELQSVEGFVRSFDLSNIICEYYKAYVGADDEKKAHYARVQAFSAQFRDRVGSIVCRDILAGHVAREVQEIKDAEDEQLTAMLSSDATPTPRTEEYYRKRPCGNLAFLSAYLLS